jgi:hypothetical protein
LETRACLGWHFAPAGAGFALRLGFEPQKRWEARATLQTNGYYLAGPARMVGNPGGLVTELRKQSDGGRRSCLLFGRRQALSRSAPEARRAPAESGEPLLNEALRAAGPKARAER